MLDVCRRACALLRRFPGGLTWSPCSGSMRRSQSWCALHQLRCFSDRMSDSPAEAQEDPDRWGPSKQRFRQVSVAVVKLPLDLSISHHANHHASVFSVTVARIPMSRHDRRLSAALPRLIPQGLQLLPYRILRMEHRLRLSQKLKPVKKRSIMAHI